MVEPEPDAVTLLSILLVGEKIILLVTCAEWQQLTLSAPSFNTVQTYS